MPYKRSKMKVVWLVLEAPYFLEKDTRADVMFHRV